MRGVTASFPINIGGIRDPLSDVSEFTPVEPAGASDKELGQVFYFRQGVHQLRHHELKGWTVHARMRRAVPHTTTTPDSIFQTTSATSGKNRSTAVGVAVLLGPVTHSLPYSDLDGSLADGGGNCARTAAAATRIGPSERA